MASTKPLTPISVPADRNRREFILTISTVAAVLAAGGILSTCGGSEDEVVSFNHGVASGDPLADRIILWTHAKYSSDQAVRLQWQIATDGSFTRLVQSGFVVAGSDTGFTAKVDVGGLIAGTDYFYRFLDDANHASAVGRTRTLPVGPINEVKLAVFSCSDYPAGYFNAYGAAAASGAQFALHLGDYIYEYQDGIYPPPSLAVQERTSLPPHECITLADYRARHAAYKSDPHAKILHAAMPFIAVWDDHEFADNAWTDGALNHDRLRHGNWAARKAAASQAFHEWMPIRSPDPANLLKIYRSFDFGTLLSLHMADTRIIGRELQVDHGLNAVGRALLLPSGTFNPFTNTKQLLGLVQESWLTSQMAASKATWQALAQQVIMARITIPRSTLASNENLDIAAVTTFLEAKVTPTRLRTQAQIDLLDPAINPRVPYNFDAWDGYPIARETILRAAQELAASGKKFVALSGDSHNAWYNKLSLDNGRQVGAEFATPSVSSPGIEAFVPSTMMSPVALAATFRSLVDDIQYIDTARRGYLLMTFTPALAKGEFVFVSSVTSTNFSVTSHTETYAG